MNIAKNRLAAVVFGLAVVAVATPGLAQRSPDQHRNPDHMSSAREQALRECTALENKYTDYTYGVGEIEIYRACMAQHGQPEP
jgi:hypothetical protein